MSTATKRCHYEVLGLPQTCTQDEIRSAYRKLALQRHPDKLVQSGVSSADATSSFQELVHAYEVLSDPKERHWYDSHRSQILFSDLSASDASGIPNLFSYFSPSCYTDFTDPKKGFYKVYGDVFDRIFANEVNFVRVLGLRLGDLKEAPVMGDLKSGYNQANAFYGYWLGFATVMDFGWVDKYDVSSGENRKVRRLMEEENKKVRKKARKEFNETVRGLAEFVKKRDKRVIEMVVMKEKEREKKRVEELERRKKIEREKLEKAKMYQDPEWARVHEDDVVDIDEENEEEDEEERKELYCVACRKKFKSDKQWKNHEKSKKHKEKVEELKASFAEEDEVFGDEEEVESVAGEDAGFQSAEDGVSELEEEFKDGLSIQEEEEDNDELPSAIVDNSDKVEEEEEEEEEEDGDDLPSGKVDNKSIESDDETSVLKAMISGHKSKRRGTAKRQQSNSPPPVAKPHVDSEEETEVVTEYNDSKKSSRKSRRAKGAKAKNTKDAALEAKGDDKNSLNEEADYEDDMKYKGSKKTKNSSRSTKQKGKTRQSEPSCEQCGEEFESRSKLHKHLKDTGHASLKSR